MKKITDESIRKYRRYLTEEEKLAATLEKYIRDVTAFAAWLGDGILNKAAVLCYPLLCPSGLRRKEK